MRTRLAVRGRCLRGEGPRQACYAGFSAKRPGNERARARSAKLVCAPETNRGDTTLYARRFPRRCLEVRQRRQTEPAFRRRCTRMSAQTNRRRDWFAEFRRRRMFRAMVAYFVGAWLLLQIASVTFPPLGLPEWMQRALIIALAVGVVPAFALAWIYDLTAHGVVRTDTRDANAGYAPGTDAPAIVGAQSALLPASERADDEAADSGCDAAACAVASAPAPGDTSIAILPFADLSPARDQDWFCDGLAEEIIDALCCVRKLRVASRTASFRYRDGSVDPREIGRQLRVGAILEGSVRKA